MKIDKPLIYETALSLIANVDLWDVLDNNTSDDMNQYRIMILGYINGVQELAARLERELARPEI